jgi:Malectin domain
VSVQGQVVAAPVDLFSLVGKNKAYVITTTTSVTPMSGGTVLLEFINDVENSKVNAIEIIPITATQPLPSPVAAPASLPDSIRVNAGATQDWKDPATGYTWLADKYYQGGIFDMMCPKNISETDQDELYCDYRSFSKGGKYVIPVSPGTFIVTLMFAEIWFGQPNQRVYQIAVNGVTVATRLDLFEASGGKGKAYKISTTTTAVKGDPHYTITIDFTNIIENASISAIEVTPIGQ